MLKFFRLGFWYGVFIDCILKWIFCITNTSEFITIRFIMCKNTTLTRNNLPSYNYHKCWLVLIGSRQSNIPDNVSSLFCKKNQLIPWILWYSFDLYLKMFCLLFSWSSENCLKDGIAINFRSETSLLFCAQVHDSRFCGNTMAWSSATRPTCSSA